MRRRSSRTASIRGSGALLAEGAATHLAGVVTDGIVENSNLRGIL